MECTYTFQTYRGEETITGMANMKAFLVLNGVDAIGRTAFSRSDAPIFYSQLSRAIDTAKFETAPATQWKMWLAGNAPKLGVKKDEIEWTGINEWLSLQQGKVSKADIQAYLDGNGVQVTETVLGEVDEGEVASWWNDEGGANEETPFDELTDAERANAIAQYRDEVADYEEEPASTKYSKYTVPGGENYKELLLTLPFKSNAPTYEQWKDNQLFLDENNDVSRKRYDEVVGFYNERGAYAKEPIFKSDHWSQPNILAHVRFDERTDADGKRVLFINEVQSDWQQSRRKAIDEITKPQSITKLGQNLFGANASILPSFNVMDGGMLSALKYDQVRKAVISLLPVDVVNNLSLFKFAPNDIFSNPDMVFNRLPIDTSLSVSDGILNSMRKVGADLRTKLFSLSNAGGDQEILPTLKASDLDTSVVVGLLSPERIYHIGLSGSSSLGGIASPRAENLPASIDGASRLGDANSTVGTIDGNANSRQVTSSTAKSSSIGIAGFNSKNDTASLTRFIDWHNNILAKKGISKQMPPNAPFVTETKAFVSLALKRMMRYAVDNGFDKIAFINGQQAADLYDLSKQVDVIEYLKNNDDTYRVAAFKGDSQVFDNSGLTSKELEDVVGKEIAEKIVNDKGNPAPGFERGNWKELSGLDLRVGGEGMRAFYDQIVPQVANDVLKKVGGGKVEETTFFAPIELRGEDFDAKAITITPDMAEKISGGLPLFKRDPMTEAIAGLKRQQTEAVGKVQSHVNTITQGWANAPQVTVVFDMNDERIPEAVRRENERQLSQGASGQPEGFIVGGKVYIVASEMRGLDDVTRVLFHESLGHYGLRGFYDRPELNKVLDEVAKLRSKDVAAKATQYGLNINNERDLRLAAEEVLAEMAQTRPDIGFVKRAISAIRTWLRENVPYFKNMALTDDEIIRNYLLPARQFVERGGVAESAGVVAFNRNSDFGRQVDEAIRGDSKGALTLGKTPTALLNAGIPDTNLMVTQSVIDKIIYDHGLPVRTIKALPELLSNPVMVFKSATQEGSFVIQLDAQKDGLPIVAVIKPNGNIERIGPVNVLASAYSKPVGVIGKWIESNLLVAADKQKALAFASTNGLQLPAVVQQINKSLDVTLNQRNDPVNDDSAFSRTSTIVNKLNEFAAQHEVTAKAFDYLKTPTAQEFGALGGQLKNIRTQYDKAKQDPDGFGRMFNAAQMFELDARTAAARPAERAPTLLGKDAETLAESVERIKKGDKYNADRVKVADYLFEGTLAGASVVEGKVFTDDELKAKGATDTQIKLYREARAAIDQSLQETAASLAYNMIRADMPELKDAIRNDPWRAPEIIRAEYSKRIDSAYADIKRMVENGATQDEFEKNKSEVNRLVLLRKHVREVFDHTRELQKAGYMPLSRFGRYSVTAYDNAGNVSEFYRFDNEFEAKGKAKELESSYPRVERGVMPENTTNIFAGADPETVALFVEHLENTGFDVKDDVFQEWYKSALSDRSALKRMIERKGTTGFDRDIERVLSSFITSNSRFASSNLNRGDMLGVLEYLKSDPKYKRKGDVFDEAKALYDYVTNPADPFSVGRSLMFTWFMGGSLASAAVNMTQPLTMTFPELAGRVGAKKAASALKASMRQAGAIVFSGKMPEGELGEALKRAQQIGLVDPQQTHHLYRLGFRTWADKIPFIKNQKARLQGVGALWGMMFARAESLNRYNAFIAAYNLAKQDNTLGDPFAFAKEVVEITQGIYDKTNRPNWARGTGSLGAVGAAAFTFKQYSIAYMEMLARNYKRGGFKDPSVLWQLGILMLLGGAFGLPGADDGEDLADTALQFMGGEGNTRRTLRNAAYDALGEDLGGFALYGVSAFLPFDVQGRMSMGNLLPASDIFKPSNNDRARSLSELFGAPGSVVSDTMEAIQGLESGKGAMDVLAQFAPVALKNAFKGAEMVSTGFYDDMRGRRVIDTTESDAFFKALGFQPSAVANASRASRAVQQSVDRARQVESQIADLMAKAQFENDPEKLVKARNILSEWNAENPDLPIVITPRQVIQRVQQYRMTREERQLKATPKELRGLVANS